MQRRNAGFTLVELMVAIAIMSILLVAVIGAGLSWLNQFAVGSARQTMTIDAQAALSQMSDDIRQSRGILVENIETDPNAPTNPGKWRTSTSQLVFGKTPYHTDGTGLYDVPAMFYGKPDSIVYYIRDGVLYRRTIPADYTGNVTKPIITCSGPTTGGCLTDRRILTNVSAVQFTYFDASNNSGADPASTKSLEVNLTTTRQQSGQTITVKDKIRINPRQVATVVPPTTGGGGEEPGATQSTAGLVAGSGGLQLAFSNVTGRDVYVRGRLILSSMSNINLNTYRMDVANVGCGTRATFPIACTGQQPIASSFASTAKGTPICATSAQTATYGLTGLQAGCTPPNSTTPTFNKTSFSATTPNVVSTPSCSFFSPPASLAGNSRIEGDVTASFCSNLSVYGNVYIKGNLNLGSFSTLKVAEGITVRPIIVVNGRVTINFSTIKANSAGVRPYIISFYSANATCSASDSCSSITNPEIYDSITTSPAAINVTSNSNVNASLYAFFGTLNIDMSNVTGALAGQEVIVGALSGVQLLEGKWPS